MKVPTHMMRLSYVLQRHIKVMTRPSKKETAVR